MKITILLLLCSSLALAQPVDIKHLSLDLTFDWQKRQATGTATLTLSPMTETNTISLDAGMLTIQSISLKNKPLQFTYDGGDADNNLTIQLGRRYKPAETLTLTIQYHTNHENRADPNAIGGSFGKGLRFQQPTSTTPTKLKQLWSSGEPDHNKYWFPGNEDIADIHTTDLRATVEKPLLVISNGDLTEITDNKDNTRTFQYKTQRPFPNYLVSIVAGDYQDVVYRSGKVLMHNFGYPQEKEAVQATTELLPDMLQWMEARTGYKYPHSQYTQVMVQDYPFPGLNGQHTASIMSDNYIDDYGVHKDFKYLWDGVAVQALANQWFGNLLMPKSWDDIWLNNAFAQYFAGLYTEKNNTKDEYLSYILPWEKSLMMADWNSDNKHPIVTNKYKSVADFSADNYAKFRGGLVLRMLQKEMGDDLWWKAIQLYVNTHAHQQVTTADFQRAVEQVSGQSYQWFFDQWIYKIGMPKFEVTHSYDSLKKQLTLRVKQTQSQENKTEYVQVDFFRGKMDIETGDVVRQVSLEPKAENVFTFSMPQPPAFVHFNCEDTWICETEFNKTGEAWLKQLSHSKDVLARGKAMDQLVAIANDSTTTTDFKNRISAAFKKEITGNGYWRYRQYALGSLRKITPQPYDDNLKTLLVNLIKTEKSWLKTSAIFTLGNTADAQYFDLFQEALRDESDRVINAAAIAIGKTKSPKAYEVLLRLADKPSWKSQSRISALNGLEQLGDARGAEFALACLADQQSPRWYLATPVWDYPFAAVNTLVALGKAELAYPMLLERLKKSLSDKDLNDVFQNVQLIDLLKDKRASEVYTLLKETFKADAAVLESVMGYERNYLESVKK